MYKPAKQFGKVVAFQLRGLDDENLKTNQWKGS